MEVELRNVDNEVVGRRALKEEVFGSPVTEHLLHQVVVAQLAARRRGTASAKSRDEVSGSSAKPWRQKGLGRARVGTRRTPIWRGGGVVFPPKPRSFAHRVPKKVRRAALRGALSQRQGEGALVVVDAIEMEEPKTKAFAAILEKLGLERSVLVVLPEANPVIERSARNLPRVSVMRVEGLNVYDILKHDHLLLVGEEAVAKVEERLGHG
ncbi:MAG: 50S ribosomal protein L4 [Candidatus Tectimicrobiota bacterium]